MEFRETTQEDLDFMADHSISRGIQKHAPEQVNYTFTLEHEGVPLGVGGFSIINTTTSWCWLDLADSAENHIIVAYRVIREWIDIFVKDHKIKRLQAYVECDFKKAIRMVEHLGFVEESIMENFIGEKDAFMYRKIT